MPLSDYIHNQIKSNTNFSMLQTKTQKNINQNWHLSKNLLPQRRSSWSLLVLRHFATCENGWPHQSSFAYHPKQELTIKWTILEPNKAFRALNLCPNSRVHTCEHEHHKHWWWWRLGTFLLLRLLTTFCVLVYFFWGWWREVLTQGG